MATQISVYLDDGRVFDYSVPSHDKAREHSFAIVATGYRHMAEGSDEMEHFPPHRIVKVKCKGGMTSSYTDTTRGT